MHFCKSQSAALALSPNQSGQNRVFHPVLNTCCATDCTKLSGKILCALACTSSCLLVDYSTVLNSLKVK